MKFRLFSIALALASVLAVRAAPSNRVVLDIPSSAEHPRNSEGGFATLKSGRIVFAYSQFYGGADDNSSSRIAEVDSDDAGLTWSAPRVIVDNGRNLNLMSVSFLRLADGRLALFYLMKKTALDCRPVVSFSADEGGTWSEPSLIVPVPGYFVLNNDRVIQTRSGRIIVPVAFHRARSTVESDPEAVDERGLVLWTYSDDGGASWRESGTWWSLPVASRNGLQEPGVVELAHGSLFSWARTDQGAPIRVSFPRQRDDLDRAGTDRAEIALLAGQHQAAARLRFPSGGLQRSFRPLSLSHQPQRLQRQDASGRGGFRATAAAPGPARGFWRTIPRWITATSPCTT